MLIDDISDNRLSWISSHNGVSVDSLMDIRTHPVPSNTVVVIIGGLSILFS